MDFLLSFPAEVARLLRAATARDPGDRPSSVEFGQEFIRALWGDDRRLSPLAAGKPGVYR